jgi:Flp pilus assembly protein TadG
MTRRGERGSALVEFALVSTALLMLIFGIIDFGRALYTYHLVSNAARLGTRYAIVRGTACTPRSTPDVCPATTTQVQTYVRGTAPGVDPNAMTVTTTWPTSTGCTGTGAPGCVVSVQVQYTFHFMTLLMPHFTLPISSTSKMVVSQ